MQLTSVLDTSKNSSSGQEMVMAVSVEQPAWSVTEITYSPSPPKQESGPKQSPASGSRMRPGSLEAWGVYPPVPPVAVKQMVAMSSSPQRLSCVNSAANWISSGEVKAKTPVVSRHVLEDHATVRAVSTSETK